VCWDFLAVEGVVQRAEGKEVEHDNLLKQLSVGSKLLFKVWQLVPKLKYLVLTAMAAVMLAVAWALRATLTARCPMSVSAGCRAALYNVLGSFAFDPSSAKASWLLVILSMLLIVTLVLLAGGLVSVSIWLIHRVFDTKKSMTVIASGVLFATVGWIVALFHLYPLNSLYLRIGRIKVPSRQ